jgi:Tfp pilus assembly protein PilO
MSAPTAIRRGDQLHGTPLVRRVIEEHRRTVMAMAAVLVINVLAYALVVYPLSRQVADVAGRDTSATAALRDARRAHDLAAGTLTGKDRAATQLATFYKSVLPGNVSSARRLTFLPVFQLASESGLTIGHTTYTYDEQRDPKSTLSRLDAKIDLSGSYAEMRSFVHQLEVAPEFVVIDNIELSEDDTGGDLNVKLELSTYFRTAP